MPTMILGHMRSRSSLLANCFENEMGEIFNLAQVNPAIFSYDENYHDPTPLWLLWRQPWTKKYLEFLKEKIQHEPRSAFKVFYEHIIFSEELHRFIRELNPKVFAIHRRDKLAAVKSDILAKRRGYRKNMEKDIEPFLATHTEVFWSYAHCVWTFNLGVQVFQPEFVTTYEDFTVDNFVYREKTPGLVNQNSAESFAKIANEAEVDAWIKNLMRGGLCP